jgi:hypothetical protein
MLTLLRLCLLPKGPREACQFGSVQAPAGSKKSKGEGPTRARGSVCSGGRLPASARGAIINFRVHEVAPSPRPSRTTADANGVTLLTVAPDRPRFPSLTHALGRRYSYSYSIVGTVEPLSAAELWALWTGYSGPRVRGPLGGRGWRPTWFRRAGPNLIILLYITIWRARPNLKALFKAVSS